MLVALFILYYYLKIYITWNLVEYQITPWQTPPILFNHYSNKQADKNHWLQGVTISERNGSTIREIL